MARGAGGRGGIALKDYTQGTPLPSLRRNGLECVNFGRVSTGLFLASIGLGMLELIAPRRVQRMIGVRKGDYSGLIRFLGVRELLSALLIYQNSRPVTGVWSRVAGDLMDLSLLAAAFDTRRAQKDRLTRATAFIAGTTALDLLTATQLQRRREEAGRYSVITNDALKGRAPNGAFRVKRSITINRSPEELYAFWRNFENLPQFMIHLEQVQVLGDRRSHWVAKAPAGTQVAWDAEITDDEPGRMISWRSLPGADVSNYGSVFFHPAPAGQGTEVQVEIEYRPPAGRLGKIVAMLFGEEPGQQVKADLNRFKQVMETGEILISDGSPLGLGQKTQHPGQPARRQPRAKIGKNFFKNLLPGKRYAGEEEQEESLYNEQFNAR